jgi:hypothetical protein
MADLPQKSLQYRVVGPKSSSLKELLLTSIKLNHVVSSADHMVQFDSAQLVLLSFGFIPPVSKSIVRISTSSWNAKRLNGKSKAFRGTSFSNLEYRTIHRKYDANSVGLS